MIKSHNINRYIIGFISLLVALFGGLSIYTFFAFPDNIEIFEDETKVIDVSFPFSFQLDDQSVLEQTYQSSMLKNTINIKPTSSGDSTIFLTLFDKIKIKSIAVSVKPTQTLIPGGESIGVKMNITGVLVVGLEEIPVSDTTSVNPGLEAGLQLGDTILEIDGELIKDADQVKDILNATDDHQAVTLKINRSDKIQSIKVQPVLSFDENQYRLGLWVRDKTAGIGTLTFYNPVNGTFGALGHAITDPDTGVVMGVQDGEIINSKVVSIKQGEAGNPGEIRGIFYETDHPLGVLYSNTNQGVFGVLYEENEYKIDGQAMEIGYQNEVVKGNATILTTLDTGQVEEYEIYIEKINLQLTSDTKSMVIKVTDERLLEKSGGIIQGMSGSPIIQNGKIIGAVTHVFVNNPQKGYGIFIEWMLKEADKVAGEPQDKVV